MESLHARLHAGRASSASTPAHHLLSTPLLTRSTVPRTHWHTTRTNAASRTHSSITTDTDTAGAALPKTFSHWVASGVGASFREAATLQQVPLQMPGAGQVLVRMYYAGINGGCETFRARGEFAFRRKPAAHVEAVNAASSSSSTSTDTCNSSTAAGTASTSLADAADSPMVQMGAEGAGIVVAIGPDVRKVKVGQPVAVNGSSAFSEYCLATERLVTAVPKLGPEAAVLAVSGMTAISALEGTARMRSGEVLVVTAAAGGTGHYAVQLGLLAGCHVVAVCGGAVKAQRLQALRQHQGSLTVIDHTVQDVKTELQRLHPDGVDVVYEGVGGMLRQQLLACLKPGGRFLQVGYISEYPHAKGYPAVSTSGDQGSRIAADVAEQISSATRSSSWQEAVQHLPAAWQLFWGGVNITGLPGARAVYGQVWPPDARVLMRCKARVYDLAYDKGALDIWVSQEHGLQGLQHVPDAIEYMLQGVHIGKVVLRLA